MECEVKRGSGVTWKRQSKKKSKNLDIFGSRICTFLRVVSEKQKALGDDMTGNCCLPFFSRELFFRKYYFVFHLKTLAQFLVPASMQ